MRLFQLFKKKKAYKVIADNEDYFFPAPETNSKVKIFACANQQNKTLGDAPEIICHQLTFLLSQKNLMLSLK